MPPADPDDIRQAKRRCLTDDERELYARGLTLVRDQMLKKGSPTQAEARRLSAPTRTKNGTAVFKDLPIASPHQLIADVMKLLDDAYPVPPAGPDDLSFARHLGLADGDAELFARGITLRRLRRAYSALDREASAGRFRWPQSFA